MTVDDHAVRDRREHRHWSRFLPDVGDAVIEQATKIEHNRLLIMQARASIHKTERHLRAEIAANWTEDEIQQARKAAPGTQI